MKAKSMSLPKLDTDEAIALTMSTLLSQLVFLIVSFITLVVMDALVAGKGISSLITFSWATPVISSLTTQPPLITLWIACITAIILFAFAAWSEARGLKNEQTRQNIIASRQGIAGEMPRLPFLVIILLMSLVGFSEELLFRFLVLGALMAILTPLCGIVASIVIAVILSAVVFCLAHTFGNNTGPLTTWLMLGILLGITYVISDSLLVVAAAHALYNIAVLISQRIEMRRNPDYFGGSIPTRKYMDSDDA